MEFTCLRAQLAEALALVSEAVPARNPLAVLQNIQLAGREDGTLALSATDLEIGLCYVVETETLTDPETVLLQASRLHAIIRDDWSEKVTVKTSGGKAELVTANGRFTLMGSSGADFPPVAEMEHEGAVSLHGDDLVEAVQKTSFATARGDTRYALNGIFLSFEEASAEFVASDTHRLSRVKKKIRNPDNASAQGIVITKGMGLLARLAANEENVAVKLTARELRAKTSRATLVARLVDGQFPRYRDVIPAKGDRKVTVAREEFMKLLRLAGQMTPDETREVKLETAEGRLRILATGAETGDADLAMDAEVEGGELSASFNYAYLIDALKVIDDEKTTFHFREPNTPIRIDAGDYTHVLMSITRAR